ncbi:MAG: hypothetical protein ACRDPF_21585 [Streptosporangiaceae bacterium]
MLWDVYRDLKDAGYRLIGTEATMSLLARSGIGPDTTGSVPRLRARPRLLADEALARCRFWC